MGIKLYWFNVIIFTSHVLGEDCLKIQGTDAGYLNWVLHFTDGSTEIEPEAKRGKKWKFNNCYPKTIMSIDIQNTQINGWDGYLDVQSAGVEAQSLTCTNGCECLSPSCLVYPTTLISVDGNDNTAYSTARPVVCINSIVCTFTVTSMKHLVVAKN